MRTSITTPWQIVRVRNGSEARIANLICALEGVQDAICAPVTEGRRALGGYVAVQAVLTPELLMRLRAVPGVRDVIGESAELHRLFCEQAESQVTEQALTKGDGVRVTEGSFVGMFGQVEDCRNDGSYRVLLDVFGRATVVEIPAASLERS